VDLFLTYTYLDEPFACGLAAALAGRGLELGPSLSLWPGQRLLPRIDQRLGESRSALVIISREFLKFSWSRTELDLLVTRGQVHVLLSDVTEAEVAEHSSRLAAAAIPGAPIERLVHLFRLGRDE
jgi:hypothetical protein